MIKITQKANRSFRLTHLYPVNFIYDNLDKCDGYSNLVRVSVHNNVGYMIIYQDNSRETVLARRKVPCTNRNCCCDYYLSKEGDDYILEHALEKYRKVKERVFNSGKLMLR